MHYSAIGHHSMDLKMSKKKLNFRYFLFFLTNVVVLSGADTDGTISLGSGKVHSLPLSSVYTWGNGISSPLRLPMLNTEVLQVSLGRTQKMGVTKSGRLITWEVCIQQSFIYFKPDPWILCYVNVAGRLLPTPTCLNMVLK